MTLIPTDEFFEFERSRQQKLVDGGYVVVQGELATSIPSPEVRGIYVFERPVVDRIVTRLKRGKYTADTLANEEPISETEFDDLLTSLRRERVETLTNHTGMIRVTDTTGAAYMYTFESIPFEARVRDPTLGHYLLVENDEFLLTELPLPASQNDRDRNVYVSRAVDFWEIPSDELESTLESAVGLADSTLGPLPVPETLPNVADVVDRLLSIDASYERKRHTDRRVKQGIGLRKTRCRRNPSLPAFQEFSLYLADINRFGIIENDPSIRRLAEQGAQIFFRCLYGSMWPGESTEWVPFDVVDIHGELSQRERRILELVNHQPAKNADFVDRWGFDDGSSLYAYLNSDFDRFAFRNTDKYICATESARRQVIALVERDAIEVTKNPPVVPSKRRISLDSSHGITGGQHSKNEESGSTNTTSSRDGVDWSSHT